MTSWYLKTSDSRYIRLHFFAGETQVTTVSQRFDHDNPFDYASSWRSRIAAERQAKRFSKQYPDLTAVRE